MDHTVLLLGRKMEDSRQASACLYESYLSEDSGSRPFRAPAPHGRLLDHFDEPRALIPYMG